MSYLYVTCLNHLNITWAVGVVAVNIIVAVAGVPSPVAGLVGLFTTVPLTLWALRQKNRSGWWFFLGLLGSPLWLRNKTELMSGDCHE